MYQYIRMKEEEIRLNFAKNLYNLRKARKLSQAQLADALNYSYKAVSKWENQETIPDIATLSMIAEYFEISVDDLISNRDVVKKTTKKKIRILTYISSMGLCFLVTAIVFLILSLLNVPKAYIATPFAFLAWGIVSIVLTSLWFKRIHLLLSITLTIWSSAIIAMFFMDFYMFWIILIVAGVLNLVFIPFIRLFKHQ